MLTRSQIHKLVEQNIDYRGGSGLMNGSKHYFLFYKGFCELDEDLTKLMPYAPHWRVNEGVLCTSKLVYARIISDLVRSRGGSVDMVYGQAIPSVS